MKLIFKAADVRRIVEHSIKSKQCPIPLWETASEQNAWMPDRVIPDTAHIILAHDRGIYLMSNGFPGDKRNKKCENESTYFAAYAQGCDPIKDPNWYETYGLTDDFGEFLPWAGEILEQINDGAKEIIIDIGANRLELLKQERKQ